ncbi:MAG: collagen-like protein [Bacteroidales bacterium]|nr:collagen-like protein [Bacteroidales bacterium]MBQ7820021.1 collagen-like protein [Bacteroidales bacterium]
MVSGYLYVWDGSKFVNCGQFKGDKGDKGDQGEPGSPGADGLPGQQGCILRYAEWAIDIEWRNDEEITENVTRYLDCALVKNAESTTGWDAYKCIKTHVSSVDTMPSVSGGSEYWEPFGLNVPAVFTNVILAKNAHIDLMQGNDILVKKSDASVTAGMSGSDEGEKIRFWAGDTEENKENAPYQVDENGVVTSTMFRTGKTGMRMECFSGLIQFFNADGFKNIEFGVNAAGMATMSYYDNNGNLLYDLGPEGITKIDMSEEKWTPYYLRNLGTSVETILSEKQYKNRTYSEDYLVYQYKSKVVAGVVDKPDYDNKFFTNIVEGAPEDATLVADGYYQSMPSQSSANNTFGEIRISNYDGRLLTSADLPNLNIYNEPVYATAPVYTFGFQYISNGKYSSKQFTAYWNG